MKLPFNKPADLIKLEPKIQKLLVKHSLDRRFTVEDLEIMAFHCLKGREFRVFDPVIKHLKSGKEIEEVLMVLHNELWNHTPLKILDGKSPWQMVQDRSPKESSPCTDDWVKISELLLSIQGSFQKEVYGQIKNLGHKMKKDIFSYSHLLFQLYLYSALENRDGTPSWQDIIGGEARRLNIKVPSGYQISIYVFRTPRINPRSQEQMRMSVGVLNWDEFPVIHDLKGIAKGMYYFKGDDFYTHLLDKLAGVQTEEAGKFIRIYLSEILHIWWMANKDLQKSFKFSQWYDFWLRWLSKAGSGWCSTDNIFDEIVAQLNKAGINTEFVMQNIKGPKGIFCEPRSEGEFLQEMLLFHLGVEYSLFFLTPLTTYLPLLEIHYNEPCDVGFEIRDYASFKGKQPFPISVSKPASSFKFKSLGKFFLTLISRLPPNSQRVLKAFPNKGEAL